MKRHVIIIEVRHAREKSEKGVYGRTETTGNTTTIFLNGRQAMGEFINTYFHELTHAFNYVFGFKGTNKAEEDLARLVGNVTEPCFRRYKHGRTSEHKRTGK